VCGAFYRVAGGEVRGRRRPTAVGFELIGFDIDSGRGVDGARTSAGEGRRPGGSSIQLHPSAGG
jgi:hypothetical protein